MFQIAEILSFWYEETDQKYWFQASDSFDAQIRLRFETLAIGLAADLTEKTPHDWEDTPEGALALILALDQFPRNMYRGTPGAFAWDLLALPISQRMIDKGYDLKIPLSRRSFIYMPFMHSENMEMQDMCVTLCESRLENENTLFHAKAHREVIEKFGRFPHRNAILGRDSTEDELSYLSKGGYAP